MRRGWNGAEGRRSASLIDGPVTGTVLVLSALLPATMASCLWPPQLSSAEIFTRKKFPHETPPECYLFCLRILLISIIFFFLFYFVFLTRQQQNIHLLYFETHAHSYTRTHTLTHTGCVLFWCRGSHRGRIWARRVK